MAQRIQIKASVQQSLDRTWDKYTLPEHIVQWNFADVSWHCPSATNELRAGGTYFARMEARDQSAGFDFVAEYTEVIRHQRFTYEFGGRLCTVSFLPVGHATNVRIEFDAEEAHSVELQRQGWMAILNRFKAYAEGTSFGD
jgi:uncharacterized protein YndB with AHSA1/START domain